MKVKTEVLKELVSRVSVGVGDNKLIPITELLCIKAGSGNIQLESTDVNNYVFVFDGIDVHEDFEVTVYADQFIKLIGKITSEDITLVIDNGNLVVRTDKGTYTIELPLDENGEPIVYPDPRTEDKGTTYTVDAKDIKNAIQIAKASLATTLERPALTNYYVGDSIFATDGCVVTEYKVKLFDKAVLMSAKLMDIISSITDDVFDVIVADDHITISSTDMEVYSKITDSASEYATDAVKQFISTKFDKWVKVRTADILSALDRISLFVDKYDNQAVRLVFDKNNIVVSNVKSGSEELVEITERKVDKNKKKFEPFEVFINVQMLTEQLKSYIGEVVTINYGTDFAISLSSENTTQIVSLMEV